MEDIPCIWNLKRNDTNELTYKTERDSDLETELMTAGRWKRGGKGQVRSLGWTCTHCCISITNKNLLSGTWNSAQCYVAVWTGGKFGGEWIHVYVWLSSFTVHLRLSQHCLSIGYTPMQNKKLKIKNEKASFPK